jgi:hypothetical protein
LPAHGILLKIGRSISPTKLKGQNSPKLFGISQKPLTKRTFHSDHVKNSDKKAGVRVKELLEMREYL